MITEGAGDRKSFVRWTAEHSDRLQDQNHFFKLSCLKVRKERRFTALQLDGMLCVCMTSRLYINHFAHLGNVRSSEVQAQKIHFLEGPNNN